MQILIQAQMYTHIEGNTVVVRRTDVPLDDRC